MNRPSLLLAPGKDKAVLRRHPWIFSGAVARRLGSPADGDLVDVLAADGSWLAVGHYQNDSIICKVLSFSSPVIDDDFWHQRLAQAVAYRRSLAFLPPVNTAAVPSMPFRLVNAEGDYLPGLVADYYNGVVVLQAHSEGMHRIFPILVDQLRSLLGALLVAVFDKSSSSLPSGKAADGFLWRAAGTNVPSDDPAADWPVEENGCRMLINFFEGQKTGFFVDQRDNRHLVASLARNRRVLNCFGYTGGFSLAALSGGASYVETVDISKKAVALCNRNVALNFPNASHLGVVADVLHYLDTVNDQFDLIILDPPAFAKNHRALQQGLKGYRNINQKAIEKIRPGGLLFTFSCSQAVSRDDFQTMAFTAAANARRRVRIVRSLPHPPDHPVSIYHPEGEYLKGLLLYIE